MDTHLVNLHGVTLKLSMGKLLVGVCYRSTASNQQNHDQLLQLLNEATRIADKSHILIMGDFNFPEIDYNGCSRFIGDCIPVYHGLSGRQA